MREFGDLEKLDEALTRSSNMAAAIGDQLLTYIIDMAIIHVRRKVADRNDCKVAALRGVKSRPAA